MLGTLGACALTATRLSVQDEEKVTNTQCDIIVGIVESFESMEFLDQNVVNQGGRSRS